MRFLVDAQLPLRLARLLVQAGHDAIHTTNLVDGNRTSDARVAQRADADHRVVVTKDRDFRDSHLLSGSPRRLLVVTTATPQTTRCWGCSSPTWRPSSRRSTRLTMSSSLRER